MRLFYLLLAISIGWSSSSVAETLTLWNGHSLEHLQPELDRFAKQSGHQVVQQHFRARPVSRQGDVIGPAAGSLFHTQ